MDPVTPPARTFSPESFGKYYLIDKVAVGGMAEVFKAKTFSHGGFEKLLVIKRILQHLSDNGEFVDMFIDEAKISVLLQAPNIVQIYDFGKIRENYFIAMECVEGKDLKVILRKLAERRKLLPTEYAVYIAHETCKGLDYAHKKTSIKGDPLGIVHRDMSPSNIIVSYTGEVKIADFGIAKAEISIYNTKDGVLKGKFEYMSPEQASGLPIDHRSDLFSVGIMLHEMLTGRRLFKSESEIKTLERIKAADAKPPSATNPSVPARLDEIVMRALSRDPRDRYADAKELQTDLLEFMYPATPDVTRESLSHFMQQLFLTEIAEERERLEEGTKVASALAAETPEIELDANWQEAGSGATLRQPPSRVPVAVAILALLLAGGSTAYFLTREQEKEVIKEIVEVAAPKPTTGTLEFRVTPQVQATIKLGDQVIGTGFNLVYDKVEPGAELKVTVEAEGYLPFSDTVSLSAGDRLRLPILLKAVPVQTAPQTPVNPTTTTTKTTQNVKITQVPQTEAPGKISVNVSQGWAEVWIDGQKVDTTPLFNHELSAGSHSIRVTNPGTGFEATKSVRVQSGKTEKIFFQVE